MQYDDKYHDNAISLTIIYDALAYKYKNDPVVVEIYDKCVNKNNIVECVYDNIPFEFDNDRDDRIIMSPKDFIELGNKGVCRDISLIRLTVLRKLGVKSMVVVEPQHVYIKAYENDKKYELNNGFLIIPEV